MAKPAQVKLPRGVLADYEPGQVHVVAMNDAKAHEVNVKKTCWCEPTVQDEGGGYTTHIHHPINPVVKGHTLNLQKLHVVEKSHEGKTHHVITPIER